jgi:hypothetical protein
MTLSFSPTRDPSFQAHQSPETVAALLNQGEFFFQGGLALTVTSSISLPPDVFFNLDLLTLSSYAQLHILPTSMGTDDGATEYLPQLLAATPIDTMGGFRPPLWITPSAAEETNSLTWQCLDRNYNLNPNDSLSLCPGSSIRGAIKPYFASNPGAVRTNTLTVSISDSQVFLF